MQVGKNLGINKTGVITNETTTQDNQPVKSKLRVITNEMK
jgi:hypothetical protein